MRYGNLDITWTSKLTDKDAEAFDYFVDTAAFTHYSQTRTWANITASGYPVQPRFFMVRDRGEVIGAAVALRFGWSFLVAPITWLERGPVVNDLTRLPEVIDALVFAARRRGSAWLRVMPYADGDARTEIERILAQRGFRDIQKPGATHAYTLRLEVVDRSDDEILAGSERETLRRKIRLAIKAGASVRRLTPDEFDVLIELYGQMMQAQGRRSNPRGWFEAVREAIKTQPDKYVVFACEQEGVTQNATLVVRQGDIATFVMGASRNEKSNFSKAVLPMLEGIKWARENGCRYFDLGGLPVPEDRDEKRTSIARFKYEFSRDIVHLVHAHAKWLLWP